MVAEPARAARRLEDDGWVLDAGQAHPGQGTRNRRLAWRGVFFELLWMTDEAQARANPLRLDRRAHWTITGASPIGLAFRGQIDPAQSGDFWLYDALGPRIWIHRDNERLPQRPLVFVLEAGEDAMRQRRRSGGRPAVAQRRGELRELRVRGPSAPLIPLYEGAPIVCAQGSHRLEIVVGDEGSVRAIGDGLVIRGERR